MLYRICTESTGDYRQVAIDKTAAQFEGFTVLDSTGYWKGQHEASMIIEICAAETDRARVYELAETIRAANQQAAVLVQEIDSAAILVEAQR